jgi:hypothetical protein
VDPQRAGRFLLLPTLIGATTAAANGTALPLAAGSLAGGSLLTLMSNAGDWGAGFNDTNPESNTVTVAGQACPVVSASSAQLTCRVPRASGVVLAEYWALPWGTSALPDLSSYTNPGEGECCLCLGDALGKIASDEEPTTAIRRSCCTAAADSQQLLPTINLSWGSGAPAGLPQLDFWAARFTSYLRTDAPGNYSFLLSSDDDAKLFINGRCERACQRHSRHCLVHQAAMPGAEGVALNERHPAAMRRFVGGRSSATAPVELQRGYHQLEVHYIEFNGWASVALSWDAGAKQVRALRSCALVVCQRRAGAASRRDSAGGA